MRLAFVVSMALVLAPPMAQAQRGAKSVTALVKEGEQLYLARKYREATEVLKKAYALSPDPRILFNIARAHEQVGDLREARDYYNRFISTSDDEVDAQLLKRAHSAVDRLRTMIEKEEQVAAAVATERKRLQQEAEAARLKAQEEQEVARRAEEVNRQRQRAEYERALASYRRSRIAAFALGGVSVASVGAGVLFGLQARDKRDAFDAATRLEDKQSLEDDTRGKALVADIGFGVGLAAALGAIVLYPKEGPPVEGEVRLTLAPRGTGAGMQVSF